MLRSVTKDSPFRILSFTDQHICDVGECSRWTLHLMEETIRAESPDLLVFVGDNVTGGENRERARDFAARLHALGIPWCPILGNHEGDNPASIGRVEMMNIFRTSPLCLLPPHGALREEGVGAYCVPILRADGSTCHKLLFFDCGLYLTAAQKEAWGLPSRAREEQPISQEQLLWYRARVREDDCPSTVFCHVPLPAYAIACEEGALLAGKRRERVCCSACPDGLFDAMCEEGKSVAMVAGHDHINDFDILYRGIRLIYNRMSGFDSYNAISKKVESRLLQGATLYTIDVDGNFSRDDILYEDRYPQYMEDIYRVIRK